MSAIADKQAWEEYREQELQAIRPILKELGFSFDEKQVHIGGERYLMAGKRDVGGGGYKLVLTGTRNDNTQRVIIKVSQTEGGIREIEREHETSELLHAIEFASHTFHSPDELLYMKHGPYRIRITAYVAEDQAFFDRSLDEQFFLALQALEAQEGVHATTSKHATIIRDVFGIVDANGYLTSYKTFSSEARTALPDAELTSALTRGEKFLTENKTTIERYYGFLTHADFVPNNMRVSGKKLYLLDYASMHFGNKYESWARFINFMIQHNPELEKILSTYVRENRGEEEYLCLRLMRVYKIAFLLNYYAQALHKTDGSLQELTRERLRFWIEAMNAVLDDAPVPKEIVDNYLSILTSLRTTEEKARQREMLGKKIWV